MKYSNNFLGWVGKTAKDYTYARVYEVTVQLAKYYKANSSSGQKVIIGYDSRFLAKDFAEFIASVMASKGIKVFLSNRIVPSSVLIFSSLHKKSMGTIVITGDEMDASFLGIRCYNANGYPMNEEKIGFSENIKKKDNNEFEFSVKKWIQKGFIEPFDPSICFENHVDTQIDFDSIVPSANRILFNPLYGSGILYFDRILSRKKMHGYTTDNDFVADFKGIEPIPELFKEQLYEDMLVKGAELGFAVSPDCTLFKFIVGPRVLTAEEIILLLAEHLHSKSKNTSILLTNEWNVNEEHLQNLGFEIKTVHQEEFMEMLELNNYLLAVDHLGRFYFEHHGAADALMAGYYLVELFNNKTLTPSSLHRKFESIDALLNE